jgi:hypothetical protein
MSATVSQATQPTMRQKTRCYGPRSRVIGTCSTQVVDHWDGKVTCTRADSPAGMITAYIHFVVGAC